MKVDKERDHNGIVIEAETPQDSELLKELWCNHAKLAMFERKPDGMTALTVASSDESEPAGERLER